MLLLTYLKGRHLKIDLIMMIYLISPFVFQVEKNIRDVRIAGIKVVIASQLYTDQLPVTTN